MTLYNKLNEIEQCHSITKYLPKYLPKKAFSTPRNNHIFKKKWQLSTASFNFRFKLSKRNSLASC